MYEALGEGAGVSSMLRKRRTCLEFALGRWLGFGDLFDLGIVKMTWGDFGGCTEFIVIK